MPALRTWLLAAVCCALVGCHREPAQTATLNASELGEAIRSQTMDGAVAFLGDSRVSLFATSAVSDRTENFGVTGQDLGDLATQIKHLDLGRARAVVIEAGLNDWWKLHLVGFQARYAAVLAEIPAGKPVVAAAVLPDAPDKLRTTYAGRYDITGYEQPLAAANADIAALCAARPGCVFVPVPPAMLVNGELDPAATFDGQHLNAQGAAIWAAALRDALGRVGGAPASSPGA